MDLRDQILQQWGGYGDWNASGIDRAAELAKMLQNAGVNDISNMKVNTTLVDVPATRVENFGDSDFWTDVPASVRNDVSLQFGDKTIGYLNDNSPYLQNGTKVSWSPEGHGNVTYSLEKDKNGTYGIIPHWGSSSDASSIRNGLLAAGAMFGIPAIAEAFAAPAIGNGAFLGEGIASGIPAWDAAAGAGAAGVGAAGAGAAGSGLFDTLGITSGLPEGWGSTTSVLGGPAINNGALLGGTLLTGSAAGAAGSGLLDTLKTFGSTALKGIGTLFNGNGTGGNDWLKYLLPAIAGYASYKDANKPVLQGYSGSIQPRNAIQTISQGKYGPIARTSYATGGISNFIGSRHDGMADGIPATLSGGEFIIPADVVSHLGNGNSQAGAQQLFNMMDRIRQARTGMYKQAKQINPTKFMPI